MNKKKIVLLALSVLLVVGTVLTAGCAGTATIAPETSTQLVTDVSAQEAFTLIQDNQKNPDFVILDVRTPEEYDDGHIAGAINLDFYEDNFRDELSALNKNQTYLLYCRSGNRSQRTLNIMKGLNFTKIYHMTGGIIEWNSEGLPIAK